MLEYKLDLLPDSRSRVCTPDVAAKAFPYYVTEIGYFNAGPEYYTRRDGKNQALLFFTVSGSGELTWMGRTCALEAGSAVLIRCDSYHEYHTAAGRQWGFHWVHLDGAGLIGFQAALLDRLTPVKVCDPDRMAALFADLERLDLRADVLGYAEASHCLSAMLLLLLRSLADGRGDAFARRAEIGQLTAYIRERLAEPLNMDDFMRLTNLSRYHLIRLFRQQMGVPPYHYLQQCRVHRAQELLRATQLSVAEIAPRVGLPDPVNFIRVFRAVTGMTPARYRRESMRLWKEQ